MNFLTASVDVIVNDSKLDAQLATVKSKVKGVVDEINKSFENTDKGFSDAFDKMVRYAKWGSAAIVGALTLSARAAMKQEDALFTLASQLKVTGEYSQSAMKEHIAFATSIQRVTTYGDEEVLMLMRMLSSLGISSSKLQEATKMAIGLGAATGHSAESMARHVALAERGQFTMLGRYIPALRLAGTETEKLAVVTKFAAQGFELAQARALTTSGSLKQMWEALSDVSEVIGAVLLPGIKEVAVGIKDWAIENQERIAWWAERVAIEINYVKEVFVSFARYLIEDFSGACDAALNAIEQMIIKAGKRIKEYTLETSGKGILKTIPVFNIYYGIKEAQEAMKPVVPIPATQTGLKFGEDLESAATKRAQAIEKLTTQGAQVYQTQFDAALQSIDNLSTATDRAGISFESVFGKASSYAQRAFHSIEGSFATTIAGLMDGTKSWGDAWQDMLMAVRNAFIQVFAEFIARQLMMNVLGFAFGGLFAGQAMAPVGHRGGVVGEGVWPKRLVPISVFEGAPRYHRGLSPREVPTILERGETVIPRGGGTQMGSSRSTININVSAIDAIGTFQFLSKNKRFIASMVQSTLSTNHPLRRQIE